jgi:hypothetical protein
MRHTDITESEWNALIDTIKRPDHVFDLVDLARAVMAKFNVDEKTAKRLVRRNDQQTTMKPRDLARLWNALDRAQEARDRIHRER